MQTSPAFIVANWAFNFWASSPFCIWKEAGAPRIGAHNAARARRIVSLAEVAMRGGFGVKQNEVVSGGGTVFVSDSRNKRQIPCVMRDNERRSG